MAGNATLVDADRKPIALVERVGEKIEFQPENLRKLLNPDTLKDIPVAFVSIAGDLRKGKSFFLNLLLKFLENEGWKNCKWLDDWDSSKDLGFKWRAGVDADTSGIIAWGKPIFIKGDDGKEKIAVILLDTQGTSEHGRSTDEDYKIFALSSLFSSLQIFNCEKQINTIDLEYLQRFVEFAKTRAKRKKNHSEDVTGNSEKNKKRAFQDLMFLVRDWRDPKYDFGTEGGQQYLDYIINKRNENQQQNEIDKYLKETFQNLKCFLVPTPGPNVVISTTKDNASTGTIDKILTKKDLGDDFVHYLEEFAKTYLHPHNIPIKTFGLSGQVTTKELIDNMEICAGILDNHLDIPNIMELIDDKNKENAMKKAVKTFTEHLNKVIKQMEERMKKQSDEKMVELSWDKFENLVEDQKKNAWDEFLENTQYGMDHKEETREKFNQLIFSAEEIAKSQLVIVVIKPVAMKKAVETFTDHLNEGIKQMEERMKEKMDEEMEELSWEIFEKLVADAKKKAWDQFLIDTRYGKDHEHSKEEFDTQTPRTRERAESRLRDLRTEYSKLVAMKEAVKTLTTHLNEGIEQMDKEMKELFPEENDGAGETEEQSEQLLGSQSHDPSTRCTEGIEQMGHEMKELFKKENDQDEAIEEQSEPLLGSQSHDPSTRCTEGTEVVTERMTEQMQKISWDKFYKLTEDGKSKAWGQFLRALPHGNVHEDETIKQLNAQLLEAQDYAKLQFQDLRTRSVKQILKIWLENCKEKMRKDRGYLFTIPNELEKMKNDALKSLIWKHREDNDDFGKALEETKSALEEWTSRTQDKEYLDNVRRGLVVGGSVVVATAAVASSGVALLGVPVLAANTAVVSGGIAATATAGTAGAFAFCKRKFDQIRNMRNKKKD